jgi:peptidyl-prolyl cis-trans isomerase C
VKQGRIEVATEFGGGLPPPLSRLIRDPLLHFLLIGALLFLVSLIWQRFHDPHRIIVDQETIGRIAGDYSRRFGAPPSSDQLQMATAGYVQDEALYREGIAEGIARDDEIVRRRVIQKMRFLIEDTATVPAPSEAELREFYSANRQRYLLPVQVSFHHLYFTTDGGDDHARQLAAAARAAIDRGEPGATERGDPFPDRSVFVDLSGDGIERVFGQSQFAAAIPTLPVGHWSQPMRSGFGWHLVYIDRRKPAVLQTFAAAKDRVASDLTDARQGGLNRRAMQSLVARYTVVMPPRSSAR